MNDREKLWDTIQQHKGVPNVLRRSVESAGVSGHNFLVDSTLEIHDRTLLGQYCRIEITFRYFTIIGNGLPQEDLANINGNRLFFFFVVRIGLQYAIFARMGQMGPIGFSEQTTRI